MASLIAAARGRGFNSGSPNLRAGRIVAAKSIAYFRWKVPHQPLFGFPSGSMEWEWSGRLDMRIGSRFSIIDCMTALDSGGAYCDFEDLSGRTRFDGKAT